METSSLRQEPIVISDGEITIKEEKGATSKKGSDQDTTLMEEKEEKSAANKRGKDKEREKPETTTSKKHKKNKPLAKKLRRKPGLARFLFHPV